MIFIRNNGTREDHSVVPYGDYLPPSYTVSESRTAGLYPVMVRTEFELHMVGPNHFVYLERGAGLDLLKGEPRV